MLIIYASPPREKMSNRDGPPPMFDGDDFQYWKIRMESYLKACDTKCLKPTTEGFTPLTKDTALNPQEQENENCGMQRPKTTSLEVFAKMSSIAWGTTKPPMSYGRNFVRSMRDRRVSVRNALKILINLKCFQKKILMKGILAWMSL